MNKTILKYGLLSGLAAATLMLCTAFYFHNSSDYSNGEIFGYTGILLSMIFVFLGVRAYREKDGGGTISFGKGFLVGLAITLISCTLYVVTWLIVYETLMPDFLEKFMDTTLAQMRASGASEAKIQMETAKMEEYRTMYQNPFLRAGLTFLEPFPVGLLATLVSALVLKRR